MKPDELQVKITADTTEFTEAMKEVTRQLRGVDRAWMHAHPEPIDWLAVALFWLVCIDLGAVAAVAVRALS